MRANEGWLFRHICQTPREYLALVNVVQLTVFHTTYFVVLKRQIKRLQRRFVDLFDGCSNFFQCVESFLVTFEARYVVPILGVVKRMIDSIPPFLS
jgi:hypothetical protein